ncbi:MAG: tRNA lysidine(34) synthetase TilS [Pyrinomonadaceae bacterium]
MKNLQFKPGQKGDGRLKRKLSGFARHLWDEWTRLALPVANAAVVVAVSGGADSTALLLACDELLKSRRLALKLIVAHLNHELRGAAGAADARWVGELAGGLGYEVASGRAAVKQRARETRDNLEQAARRERYEFLARVAREWGARAVVVAHTLDDQAETVLLALLRGSGAEGLSGMSVARTLDARGDGLLLVRPLLNWARRSETGKYCAARGVVVRADEMNEDEKFSRVRVRRQLLPLLETFNPRAAETLARTAELLRADAEALQAQAAALLAEASQLSARTLGAKSNESDAQLNDEDAAMRHPPALNVEVLRGAEVALRRRALRQWIAAGRGSLRRVESVHVAAVEKLLEAGRGGRVAQLPGGSMVERRSGLLLFHQQRIRAGKS